EWPRQRFLTTLATLTRQPLQEGCWQPRRISL
ncbi:leucyl/phenylalanyl-tRNA--protein transferase, partial [Aeromonas sp. CPF2-S1]|nr:leucyl/phenylalanyl-tRNA--protein transferase [Aeromonas sp. CPF2-S1]